jgi:hypothetical protein
VDVSGNAVSAPGAMSGDGALTGTVVLNNNNQVETWSFKTDSGPIRILTNLNTINASFNLFSCSSCSGTPFEGWSISMFAPPGPGLGNNGVVLSTSWNPDTGVGLDFVDDASGGFGLVNVTDNPGVWTEVATSTPEPSSLVSLLAGLTALGLVISRWKSSGLVSCLTGRC